MKLLPTQRVAAPAASRERGAGTLDAVVASAIFMVGMTAAISMFTWSARRSRSIASTVAMLPMKDAILTAVMERIWSRVQTAAQAVPRPGTTCTKESCRSTFGAILPVSYVAFPEAWLDAPVVDERLLKPLAGNATVALATIPSSVLASGDPAAQAVVDPAYCRATTFIDDRKVAQSYVFQLQTASVDPAAAGYASFYGFFNAMYRPLTPKTGADAKYSPPAGSLGASAVTLHRFAMAGGIVQPQVFRGGDQWLTKTGDAVVLPANLGFFWADSNGCQENLQPASVCNTVSTPIDFDLTVGEVVTTLLTRDNAPSYPASSAAGQALARCAKPIPVNFGTERELHFCLLLQRPAGAGFAGVVGDEMIDAFGEFVFKFRDVSNDAELNCAAVAGKNRANQLDYYGNLYYSIFYRPRGANNGPERHLSGTMTRMSTP